MQKLDSTWILVRCGNKNLAINTIYIVGIEDFKQADCILATASIGTKRGIYNILGMDLIVIDGRKITGEEPVIIKKLHYADSVNKIKYKLIEWVDKIEWYILTSKGKEDLELDIEKSYFYEWLNEKEQSKDLMDIKKRLDIKIKEVFILAKKAVDEKDNTDLDNVKEAMNTLSNIKYSIDKNIIKELNKLIISYNKNIKETCLVIKHRDKRYGLTVDEIEFITDDVTIIKKYKEYKVLAGECWYNAKQYDIFNLKYISELAKTLEYIKENKVTIKEK